MSKSESRKHYREVKNYIHNDLGFGREEIKDMIKEVIKERFEYEEAHGIVYNTIQSMIRNTVYNILTKNSCSTLDAPYNKVNEIFKAMLREEIENNYKITVNVEKK